MLEAVAEEPRPGFFLKTKELLPFQAEDVARAYLADGHALLWDCGTGKTVAACALAVLCFEDDVIDHVIVLCERNKVREWTADFLDDTSLGVLKHHGQGRRKRLERFPSGNPPQVLVTTYETAKRDMAVSQGPRSFTPGWLLQLYHGKRVLVVHDESTKLRNRSSGNYKAADYVLKYLRRHGAAKVLQLTATPLEKDYEDGFNQLRLAVPNYMPLIKDFEEAYIRYRDMFDRPVYDHARIIEFMARVRPHTSRRRKTDPEVIEQFPPLTEEYRYVELGQAQKDFYRMAEELAFEMTEGREGADFGVWALLRQIAGHPASIVHSAAKEDGSRFAKEIVDVLGEAHLRGLPSAKTAELIDYLRLIMDQDAKAVVFTFFGQSVLRELERALNEAGILTLAYHGGQTASENEARKIAFKECTSGAVLLASDAGARGINLPEATYVIEYESALTHAMRIQRRDRVHRITSASGPVTSMTFIAEGTIEEDVFRSVLKRNEKHDIYADDLEAGEEFVSAADRRVILAAARERYEARRK